MRLLSRWAGWSAVTALTAATFVARAQDDAGVTEAAAETQPQAASARACFAPRFVVLSAGPELDPALAAEVRTDLATELEHRGLGVCAAEANGREPAARVTLSRTGDDVVIELDDRVTDKRVARDVSLGPIPPNGRALAIAIAIDELLRASWAELTLRREVAREEPAREEPTPRVRREPTEPVSARGSYPWRAKRARLPVHLGGSLGYARSGHDFNAFALQARASLRPAEIGWFELGLGALASLPAEGELGDVVASGLTTAFTAGACRHGESRVFGCVGARAGLDWLNLRGIQPEMAQARRERATTVHASVVGQLAVTLSSELYVFGEAAFGAFLRGVNAKESMHTVMGATGLLVSLQIGLGFEL